MRIEATGAGKAPHVEDGNNRASDAKGASCLDRRITLAFGASGDAAYWKNETRGTARDFLDWLETPDPKSHAKDGLAFMQGALREGETRRQAKNMGTMEIVAFDVESGEEPEAILENADRLGIELVIYPTFNDGKPQTRVATDKVNRWAKLGAHGEANEEQVIAYLREAKKYEPWVLKTAKFIGREAQEYVVTHEPLPRFRVVAVWREPVDLASLAPTLEGIKESWERVYFRVGDLLGIKSFDRSCTDLSRLFYAHRRPEEAQPCFYRISGEALDFAAILAETEERPQQQAKSRARNKKRSKGGYATPGIGGFFKQSAKRFNAEYFLLAYGDDPVEANGGVAARCPNEHGSDRSAGHSEEDPPGKRSLWAMNASDADSGVFVIKCQHETCQSDLKGPDYADLICQQHDLTVQDLRQFIDEEGQQAQSDGRPTIRGDYDARVAGAVSALNDSQRDEAAAIKRDGTLYHNARGGVLRLLKPESSRPGSIQIEEAGTSRTVWRAIIESHMRFENVDGDAVPARKELIERLIGSQHELDLPELRRVVRLPVFAPDGTLCTEPGYIPELKAYLDPSADFRPLPDVITEAHVEEAAAILEEVLRDIPFSDTFGEPDVQPQYGAELDADGWPLPNYARGRSSRVTCLAMLMQPIIRGLIKGPCPGYHVDKPVPGTGASLIGDIIYAIYTGKRGTTRPETTDPEELRKQLTTTLSSGDDILLLDNLNCRLDSGPFAAALTAGVWKDRKLHTNSEIEVAITQTIIVAGNGLSMSEELTRRMAPIYIDANCEHPDRDRPPIKDVARYKYSPLIEAHVLSHRVDIVWALHILPAYYLQERSAGRYQDKHRQDPMGTFESYYQIFCGIFDACGINGFMAHRESYLNQRNDDKDNLSGFVRLWWERAGAASLTATAIYQHLANPLAPDNLAVDVPISGRDKHGRIVSLGRLLHRIVGRVFTVGGSKLKIVKTRDRNPAQYSLHTIP